MTHQDYMDTDMAYLLGMVFAHGQLITQGDIRRLVITVPIRQTAPRLPEGKSLPHEIDIAAENERSVNQVQRRINELLEVNVNVSAPTRRNVRLTAVFTKRTIGWRNLECLCMGGTNPASFQLPMFFFRLEREIRKEFIRGYADAAVTPNAGDALPAPHNIQRVAFPVVYANERFAAQLLKLLRGAGLKSASMLSGSPKVRGGRPREHRIRIRADEYEAIGFSFRHKQEMLRLLAEYNRELERGRDS